MAKRAYSREFKLEAVRLLRERNRPAAEIARELGISPNQIYKWRRQFSEDAEQAFPGKGRLKPEDEELRRLRRELEDAKQEMRF